MKENTNKIYFEHLDIIRFIAAFMIVILHSYEAWTGWYGEVGLLSNGTYEELTYNGSFINQFLKNFGLGVDIFFLLSGFLITYILLEEKKRFNKIHIGFFMIRRTFRIWPLYFFLVALSPFLVNWVDSQPPNYIANIFFVGNFEIISSETWTYPFSHFWSICIEEHFYLIWPFIIAFIPKRKLLGVFTIIIALSIGFRLYAFGHIGWFGLFAHTLSRIDVLVIGAIGAYFYSEKPFTFQLSKIVRYTLLIILISSLTLEPVVEWNTSFLAGFKKFFYIGIIAILLLDFNFNPSFKHRLKPGSIIHYFGKISYGIYMYSNILILIVIKKVMWIYEIDNIYIFFGLNIGLSILLPIISYELFEKHFLKLNKKFRRIETKR